MKNKQRIVTVVGISFSIIISFAIGLFLGKLITPSNVINLSESSGNTFYANIESIKQYNDGTFHVNVKGLDINDINYRESFTFKVDNNTNMTWRGEKIKASDLKEKMNISITFLDEELVSISPTPLEKIAKIQVLDDTI